MADPLDGQILSEAVATALRLASTRRTPGRSLGTHDLLLAVISTDSVGEWGRFLVDERPRADPGPNSRDSWEGVLLSGQSASALSRAAKIANAYHLASMPSGVLALALVWDSDSGAARSFVGTDHASLLRDIQSDVLGTELDGVDGLLATGRHRSHAGQLNDAQAERGLRQVDSIVPTWLFKLVTVAALVGIYLTLTGAPEWGYQQVDDLAPPIPRPAIAKAIPPSDVLGSILGTEVVQDQDGRPRSRLFDSVYPTVYDIRTQVIESAWAGHWTATNGKSEVIVELARVRLPTPSTVFVSDCQPQEPTPSSAPVLRAGYVGRDAGYAEYCTLAFDEQTQIKVAALTADPAVLDNLQSKVEKVRRQVRSSLPEPAFETTKHVSTPAGTATIRRALLGSVIALPLLWTIPTLLFDRATWQRLWWTLTLKRFRGLPLPGLDIDSFVRKRLWSSVALACTQVLVALSIMRLTWSWHLIGTALAIVGGLLAVSSIPRLLHPARRKSWGHRLHRRGLLLFVGTVSGVVAVAFAAFVMYFGSSLLAVPAGTGPDYEQQRFAVFMRLAAIPLAIVAIAPATLVRRIAMRSLRSQLRTDTRPPILLLRSFADDKRRLRARSSHRRGLVDRLSLRRWERFEEIVAASLSEHGPVESVGQPDERLPPPLGAVRRQYTEEEWQYSVGNLMREASIICVSVGRSESLSWEIQRIAAAGYLPKTIFVFPPTGRSEHMKRLAVLADALQLEWVELNVDISGGWALAVRVPKAGAQPQLIRARAQEDVAYDLALQLARLTVTGLEWETPSLAADHHQPTPSSQVFRKGQTHTYKPMLRRRWVWLPALFLSSGIVALPIVFLQGEKQGSSETIRVKDGLSVWAVAADVSKPAVYGVINGTGLYRMDFEKKSGTWIAKIEKANHITASDGWVVASNSVTGTLQGIDISSGGVVWTLHDVEGVRGVVVDGSNVFALLPHQREVRTFDLHTGELKASRSVEGIPWSAAVNGASLSITLIDQSQSCRLDLIALVPRSCSPAPSAPSILVAADGSLWAYSVTDHNLTAVDGPSAGQVIWTRSESPNFASNGKELAIEGVEMVSIRTPAGVLFRNRLFSRHTTDMAVTAEGDVAVIAGDGVELLRPRVSGQVGNQP